MKDVLTVELVQKRQNGGILEERKEFTISMDKNSDNLALILSADLNFA
jgi:hypothetical protein